MGRARQRAIFQSRHCVASRVRALPYIGARPPPGDPPRAHAHGRWSGATPRPDGGSPADSCPENLYETNLQNSLSQMMQQIRKPRRRYVRTASSSRNLFHHASFLHTNTAPAHGTVAVPRDFPQRRAVAVRAHLCLTSSKDVQGDPPTPRVACDSSGGGILDDGVRLGLLQTEPTHTHADASYDCAALCSRK